MPLALRDLPPEYEFLQSLDLSQEPRLLLILNLIGLVLFVLFGWVFLQITLALRSDLVSLTGPLSFVPLLVGLLVSYVGVLVLHELVHGLFFWFVTQHRPIFGFKGLYAYAAAPEWYIPKDVFLVIGLAPLVLISLVGVALIPFVPLWSVPLLLFALTANASGAIGDIYTVYYLLRLSSATLVQDRGDNFLVFAKVGNKE